MPRKQKIVEIELKNFGSVIGLNFEKGGAAEVRLGGLELQRLLVAWKNSEADKPRRNEQLISALEISSRAALNVKPSVALTVPIAARRAKIIPVID